MFVSRRFRVSTLGVSVLLLTLVSGEAFAQSTPEDKATEAEASLERADLAPPAKAKDSPAKAKDAPPPLMPPEGILADEGIYMAVNMPTSRFFDSAPGKMISQFIAHSPHFVGNKKLSDASGGSLEQLCESYTPMLGFNPLEDIVSVQIVVSTTRLLDIGFLGDGTPPAPVPVRQDPESRDNRAGGPVPTDAPGSSPPPPANKTFPWDLMSAGIVTFRGDSGNLEGIALMMPSYEATELDGATIHSGKLPINKGFPFVMGIIKPDDGQGPVRAVFGSDPDRVKAVVEELLGLPTDRPKSDIMANEASLALKDVVVIAGTQIDKLIPANAKVAGSPSVVFSHLSRADVCIRSIDDELDIDMVLSVNDGKRSEQVQQMLQALVGMSLITLETTLQDNTNSDEISWIPNFLERMRISRDGDLVRLRMKARSDDLIGFMFLYF